jgi:hypothetical protein
MYNYDMNRKNSNDFIKGNELRSAFSIDTGGGGIN